VYRLSHRLHEGGRMILLALFVACFFPVVLVWMEDE
jgi:hypothetical protein